MRYTPDMPVPELDKEDKKTIVKILQESQMTGDPERLFKALTVKDPDKVYIPAWGMEYAKFWVLREHHNPEWRRSDGNRLDLSYKCPVIPFGGKSND